MVERGVGVAVGGGDTNVRIEAEAAPTATAAAAAAAASARGPSSPIAAIAKKMWAPKSRSSVGDGVGEGSAFVNAFAAGGKDTKDASDGHGISSRQPPAPVPPPSVPVPGPPVGDLAGDGPAVMAGYLRRGANGGGNTTGSTYALSPET